jgi:hypothetical protein
MGRLQNQNSQDRYANYWKRLICYLLRVAQSKRLHKAESPLLLEEVEGYEEHSNEHDDDDDEERSSVEDDDDTTTPIVCDDKMRDARRLFLWRDGQKEQAEKILDSIESGNGSVTSVILDFS